MTLIPTEKHVWGLIFLHNIIFYFLYNLFFFYFTIKGDTVVVPDAALELLKKKILKKFKTEK